MVDFATSRLFLLVRLFSDQIIGKNEGIRDNSLCERDGAMSQRGWFLDLGLRQEARETFVIALCLLRSRSRLISRLASSAPKWGLGPKFLPTERRTESEGAGHGRKLTMLATRSFGIGIIASGFLAAARFLLGEGEPCCSLFLTGRLTGSLATVVSCLSSPQTFPICAVMPRMRSDVANAQGHALSRFDCGIPRLVSGDASR